MRGTWITRRLARWRARRRIFADLLAQHEHAGYQPSPATWRRLGQEAACQAGVPLAIDAEWPQAQLAPLLAVHVIS